MRTFKDILGREFRVGDVIAYPIRHGSWMDLKLGTIVEIVPKNDEQLKDRLWVVPYNKKYSWETNRRRPVESFERIVKVF